MSTRYVWEKFNVKSVTQSIVTGANVTNFPVVDSISAKVYIGKSYSVSGTTHSITSPTTKYLYENHTSITMTNSLGKYFIILPDWAMTSRSEVMYEVPSVLGTTLNASINIDAKTMRVTSSSGVYARTVSETNDCGSTSYGYLTGADSSAYPSGESGGYWYVYKGTDNIDPYSVSYPSTLKGGRPVDISVSKRTPTYGGTITYTCEVQLDGGAWTSIGSTTATSLSYTIPKGTKSFRARVRASDNMGFTSADYAYGPEAVVKNSPVYTGVNGIVRNAETNVFEGGIAFLCPALLCRRGYPVVTPERG